MRLQIDIPKEMSKELKIYRIRNEFTNQEQAVLFILNEKLNGEDEDGGRGTE